MKNVWEEFRMCKKIEDYIREKIGDDMQQAALDFVQFLRANNMVFIKDNGYWKDKIYYSVKYNESYVCFIAVNDPDEPENQWTVWSDDCAAYADSDVDDSIKQKAWQYVDSCCSCGSCGGGKQKNIFGRYFESVCGCTFRIDNANTDDLPFMRKMVELRLQEILN